MSARPTTRWRVLSGFVLAALVTQLLWLNFAPLLVDVQRWYGVGELSASLLVLPFPLLYAVLSIPSGRLIDRYGYRKIVGAGAALGALGSLVRLDTGHFAALMAGQVIIAAAQPFVVNGINKLVADWFEDDEAAVATGLGTAGMFVGMALAMATTPMLVTRVGLRATMGINSGVAVGAAVLWFVLSRERGVAQAEQPSGVLELLRNRPLRLFVVLALIGLGYFNGLSTWIEQLLAPRGLDAEQAGMVGGAIIVAGIVGAIVIPALSDHFGVRRLPLILCLFGAVGANLWLALAVTYSGMLVSGALLGFFFLPSFALLLAMTSEVVSRRDDGAAAGLIMLAGNAGGVVVILSMPAAGDWAGRGPWGVLVGLTALTLALTFRAPETFRGVEPEGRSG